MGKSNRMRLTWIRGTMWLPIAANNGIHYWFIWAQRLILIRARDLILIASPYYGAEAVIKLTPEGNFVYVAPFQRHYSHGTGLFRRMTIDAALNIYVVGSVSGTVDFDPGPAVFPLSGSSNSAPFVLKLGLCVNATASTLNINTCNSYIK